MSYVFNLHQRGLDGQDWFNSSKYGDKEITGIHDPEGGAGAFLPTAIPSPFARFDLVKTAFSNLAQTSELKTQKTTERTLGSREEEKLVSDALDVLELLFNSNNKTLGIKLIAWDPKIHLQQLIQGSTAHRRLAEALKMYLTQDADSNNFNELQRIYLIVYKHQVIGATSPLTLTAATGNVLHDVHLKIAGDYSLFDDQYDPLYVRDVEFQLFVYRFFYAHPNLNRQMKGVYDYLDKNKKLLAQKQPQLFEEIQKITTADYAKYYDAISIGQSGNVVEILGYPLYCRRSVDASALVDDSDFKIKPSRTIPTPYPLVLQNDFSKPLRYIQENWNRNTVVPFVDVETDLNKRILPGQQIEYPYLTVSDFLEPCLIRMVYPIDKQCFFDGNLIVEEGKTHVGYLLPIKTKFFDYFTASDLLRKHNDGKDWYEMRQISSDNVVVELRIPISKAGEYITFTRRYTPANVYEAPNYSEVENKGAIVEHLVGVTLFPFLRIADPDTPVHYRVQHIDRDNTGLYREYAQQLTFLQQGEKITTGSPVQRTNKSNNLQYSSYYYSLNAPFDTVVFHSEHARGLIVPRWPETHQGDTDFSFAIDFGTSNTHLEYNSSATISPSEFSMTETAKDIQLATLFDRKQTSADFGGSGAYIIRDAIEMHFLPWEIYKDYKYSFPQRTALGETLTDRVSADMNALADFNIAFTYEKSTTQHPLVIQTNLKWKSGDEAGRIRVRAFFEQLLLMMRNKVLLNGGNLRRTRIVWSYPFSMSNGRVRELRDMMHDLYRLYFDSKHEQNEDRLRDKPFIVDLPESFGPYYFYQATGRFKGGTYNRPAVSIDIGGGTSDVILFRGDKPEAGTSFRFAANSFFGGFMSNTQARENGLLQKYLPRFEAQFRSSKLNDLANVCAELANKQTAADLASFLFSLETNRDIKDTRPFNFNKLLAQDDDLRVVFVFFYTAIVYHVAQLLKVHFEAQGKTPETPGNILFSGTGSRMLSIITPDVGLLGKLTDLIFKHVYASNTPLPAVNVLVESQFPKAVTAKGGLYFLEGNHKIDFKAIEKVYHPLSSGIQPVAYCDADASFFKDYNTAMHAFVECFIALNKQLKFKEELNVSPESWSVFTNEINDYLDTTQDGFEQYRKIDGIDNASADPIGETLFFYPLTRTINALWKSLATIKPLNP